MDLNLTVKYMFTYTAYVYHNVHALFITVAFALRNRSFRMKILISWMCAVIFYNAPTKV